MSGSSGYSRQRVTAPFQYLSENILHHITLSRLRIFPPPILPRSSAFHVGLPFESLASIGSNWGASSVMNGLFCVYHNCLNHSITATRAHAHTHVLILCHNRRCPNVSIAICHCEATDANIWPHSQPHRSRRHRHASVLITMLIRRYL